MSRFRLVTGVGVLIGTASLMAACCFSRPVSLSAEEQVQKPSPSTLSSENQRKGNQTNTSRPNGQTRLGLNERETDTRKRRGNLRSQFPGLQGIRLNMPSSPSRVLAQSNRKSEQEQETVGSLGSVAQKTDSETSEPMLSEVAAARVDQLILAELNKNGIKPSPKTRDEDFLRRVTYDIQGVPPLPHEVTLFELNPDPQKRAKAIDRLLSSPGYARNWAQYWREVIFSRATDPRSRAVQNQFEEWLEKRLADNVSWGQVATELLTATGSVQSNGATALIFAHQADPEEIASEASRIFLGIQIQCANCHDHPTDKWKREQFHHLAAFFPRASLRRDQDAGPLAFNVVSVEPGPAGGIFQNPADIASDPEKFMRLVDRNKDNQLSREDVRNGQFQRVFNAMLQRADTNKDEALSIAELKAIPVPQQPGRGSAEHYMPDLDNPQDRGKKMDPIFFLNEEKLTTGSSDMTRRQALAAMFTGSQNPWFAKAFVNRMWYELLGSGFYMPVDDLGPERTPNSPEVMELLSSQFAAHKYDVKWLLRTITNTEAYQRSIHARSESETGNHFASPEPTRLRSDQLFDTVLEVLGLDESSLAVRTPRPAAGMGRRFENTPRSQFNLVFGFDPSTPPDEITGTIPQALLFMNSPNFAALMRGSGQTRLARILKENQADQDALAELYLLVLSRQPTEREIKICLEYLTQVGNRTEAFEDLMWSLLNSSEFLTKR